jgi:hypothetical protein
VQRPEPSLTLMRIPETDTAETAPPVSAATTLAAPIPRSLTTDDDTPSGPAGPRRDAA